MKFIPVSDELISYVESVSLKERDEAYAIRERLKGDKSAQMMTPPSEAQILNFLVKLVNAKKALEIGVFTGYSSIFIADALSDDGKLYAIDKSEEWTSSALDSWNKAGLSGKIELLLEDAVPALEKLIAEGHGESFDFIFIDADKQQYKDYYELSLKLAKCGALIAIDNVLWRGKLVNNENPNSTVVKMLEFNSYVYSDSRVESVMIPAWDGLTLVRKI